MPSTRVAWEIGSQVTDADGLDSATLILLIERRVSSPSETCRWKHKQDHQKHDITVCLAMMTSKDQEVRISQRTGPLEFAPATKDTPVSSSQQTECQPLFSTAAFRAGEDEKCTWAVFRFRAEGTRISSCRFFSFFFLLGSRTRRSWQGGLVGN